VAKRINEIVWKLDAENTELKRKLDETKRKLDEAGNKAKSSFGDKLTKYFKLGAVALGGLLLSLRQFISEFAPFNTGMRNVNSILQLSEDKFRQLGNEILDVQAKVGKSSKDMTDAAYQAVSAGVSEKSLVGFLETAGKVSVAGVASMTEAVDILTSTINAYHMSTDEAGKVSDILFQTVKLGKTTLGELAANLSQVAPLAAANSISLEEVSAAIATLTKQGVPTAIAITQIRSAINSVNQVLGDGWTKTMSFQEGVAKVKEQAGGSQNELKNMLGRIEAVNAVLGLTGENAQMAADDLNAMVNSFGASGAAFEQNARSIEFRWNKFIGGVTTGVIKLTDSMLNLVLPMDDLKTAIDDATDSAFRQKTEFLTLANTYEILAEKTNLTTAEKELLNETVDKLQKNYPNYLKNINFEKDGYSEISKALKEAGANLDLYLQKQIKQAVLQEKQAKFVELGKKLFELEQERIKQEAEIATARETMFFRGVPYADRSQLEKAILLSKSGTGEFFSALEESYKRESEELQKTIAEVNTKISEMMVIEPGKTKEIKIETSGSVEKIISLNNALLDEINILEEIAEEEKYNSELSDKLLENDLANIEKRQKAERERYTKFKKHQEEMINLASALTQAMIQGINDEGIKGGLKQILMAYINYLEAGVMAGTAASFLKNIFGDFTGWANVAAAIAALEGLKIAVSSFAVGVENSKGGLAQLHKDELVQLPAGSNVYSKSETKQMLKGGDSENIRLMRQLINEVRILQSRRYVIDGQSIVEITDKSKQNRMGRN
jgi:hypothetical protein